MLQKYNISCVTTQHLQLFYFETNYLTSKKTQSAEIQFLKISRLNVIWKAGGTYQYIGSFHSSHNVGE